MSEIPEEYQEYAEEPETGSTPGVEADQGVEEAGDDPVEAVLASLAGLDDLPVAEHVAVFERAHEQLRAALSQA